MTQRELARIIRDPRQFSIVPKKLQHRTDR